jgi:hypothetical protein
VAVQAAGPVVLYRPEERSLLNPVRRVSAPMSHVRSPTACIYGLDGRH